MKKIFFLLLLICITDIYGQGSVSMPTQEAFLEKIFIDGLNESFKYSEIDGSAYIDDSFQDTKVSENYGIIEARYNTYKDEIEFKKDNLIYVLPKEEKFSKIDFLKSKETLVLIKLNGKESYLFELYYNGNKSLLKKVKTILNIPNNTKNTYSDNSAPSFKTTTILYVGINNEFLEVPSKRKKIYDLFPNKRKELETKVKDNNIDLYTDKGLIEFIKLL